MCGIAGVIGLKDGNAAVATVRRMVATMARRGPDAEGIECWPEAVLGHRRLSIFDLSDAGRQPMASEDRGVALVFNGAIYNFRDLRGDLERRGSRFRSQTDTEVLIHGYREWGIDGLIARLRGMFAFALWDNTERRLFLVRDRLGVKPLYYAARDGRLAFASTVRALRAAGVVSELDATAVAEYLEYGYVTDDRAIYAGASKVGAGTVVEWHEGRVTARTYWTPPEAGTFKGTFEEAVEETRRLLLEAVKRRLYADVPVGALLSGGVDSSLVCWAVRELGGRVTAFTVSTPGDPLDEAADARLTARELGIAHEVVELAGTEAPAAEELVQAYGEPFACSSGLGMLRVSAAVKPAATVLLTGDGGDDVFLGYPEHRYLRGAQTLAACLPGSLARGWKAARRRVPGWPGLARAAHFLDYATGGLGEVARARDGMPWYRRKGVAGERLEDVKLWRREIAGSPEAARRVLSDYLEYDRRNRFTGEYMTKVDGGTMYYALEARSAFLDQDVWEFAASLPFAMRLRGGRLKAVLRELVARTVSPRVASGRKRGFGIPAGRWMLDAWRADVEAAFHNSLAASGGWVSQTALWQAWEEAAANRRVPLNLWYLYVLELWLRSEAAAGREARAASPGA